MDDPNEPTWAKAWGRLQRIRQGQDFYVTPQPSANLEDRLKAEDAKKKKEPKTGGALNMDNSQAQADKWAYGMSPTPTPVDKR